ncbi:cbb3-type cytochrome c oxidase subunit I [Anaeromyxobacter diazotrophicus]|uniref:Cytochrome c oxidase subunit 1 n=1 Tax=Anaeromyxobacter diazotrophicus TaxID=2590199 RepID=A0A7I9VRI9_9BACT|nr:cbb3-type cytochrome c oxidase subunit I [Anaeromyxobacter diazotrophicus]GEJ59046.1 cytochrome c oxidase subunit 1 [Anaeromyxobacter diazotrophicus]
MSQSPATTPPSPADAPAYNPRNYLNAEAGIRSWLLTRDHKRIGIMFLALTTLFFFVGGLFALLVRIELLTPGPTIMSAMTYNRMFTLHGVVMIFLFMIPAIPGIFGNFFLPIMLGARDVAFPRLNLLSLYLYVIGAGIALYGMIHGGTDTGWTFYAPYSTTTITKVVPVLLGAFVLGFSSIVTGLNFIVTAHTLRAPGITWMRMPLFVWSIYATSIIQILATPVLGITLLMVAVEHAFGFGIFDPARGGDPILFQHMFWFYSHPAVYIMVLPAMAVISEVICAAAHKNIFGYKAVAFSSLGIAFVGFFTWGHHLFTSGQSTLDAGIFGVLSMFVGIFTAIKVFNWTATLYKGSVAFTAWFAYFCGFLFFLVFGGMTGIALATVSLDVHWQDTYFVVAHFHFIMVGATIMAWLAALHYWWPKMFGRMYPERWGLVGAVTIVFGFNATFIPQFLLGNYGMPRRYYSYPERFWPLNVASTLGATLLGFGFLLILIYFLWSLKYGRVASANPWGSRGYEWGTLSPPPPENFIGQPVYPSPPHDYTEGSVQSGDPHAAEVTHAA